MNIVNKMKVLLCKKLAIEFGNKAYHSTVTYVDNESLQYCHLFEINKIVVEVLHSNEPYKESIFTLYYKNKPFYKETIKTSHKELNDKIQVKIDSLKDYFKEEQKGFIEKLTLIIEKKLKGASYKDGYFFYYYVKDTKNEKTRTYISCLNNGDEYFKIILPEVLDENFINSIEHFEGDDVVKYMEATSKYYDKFNCKVVLKILPMTNNNSIYILNLFNRNVEKDIALVDLASRKGKGVLVLDMENNNIDLIAAELNESPETFKVSSVKTLGELTKDTHEVAQLYAVNHQEYRTVKEILSKVFINEFLNSDIGLKILVKDFLKPEYVKHNKSGN